MLGRTSSKGGAAALDEWPPLLANVRLRSTYRILVLGSFRLLIVALSLNRFSLSAP